MTKCIHLPCKINSFSRTFMSQNFDERLGPLERVFRRRLLTGIFTASVVGVGANFCGITSLLLGFSPETARGLKLDVLYPIGGYTRCLETTEGFEFLYPDDWVGDQRLLYRAAGKAERSLDPPPLADRNNRNIRNNVNEPVVAFGPPGSNGELNVSVIASQVPVDFSIEAFGGPAEIGDMIIKKITRSFKRQDVKVALLQSSLREDIPRKIKYYTLEFKVESPSFERHNVSVCCARAGKLYTLNAQAPESVWPKVKRDLYRIAESFALTGEYNVLNMV